MRDDLRTIVDLGPVHMNGRIYDPLLGRFLSADLVVQFPNDLQSYNRYSYVQNNPLTYHDPSGHVLETVWDVANIAIGVKSLIGNIKEGNVGSAILDGVGIVADGAATALPFIPGGAGTAIKVARATAKVAGNLEKAGNTIVAADGVVTDVKEGNVGVGTAANALSVVASTKSKSSASKADGGTAPSVSKLDGGDVKTKKLDGVDASSPPVKPGDRGTYTDLKNQKRASGETEPVHMHEMPSYAAKKEAFKQEHGRYPTTAEEKKMVRDAGVTEAVTPDVHSQTSTYKGNNTKETIENDAADLAAAQKRNEEELRRIKESQSK